MEPADMAVAFRLLDKDKAITVFELLDPEHQSTLIEGLRDDRGQELFSARSPADGVRLLDEVPAKIASRLEHGLPADQRQTTAELLGYEPRTAGRLMIPAAVTLAPERTRAEAIGKLGGLAGPSQDDSQLRVTDGQRKLVGLVSPSDIVTSDAGTQVRNVMSSDVYSVSAHEYQEVAARLLQEADLLALPVVDGEQRVIGMIPFDDAMEVLEEEEETEDAYRTGGPRALHSSIDRHWRQRRGSGSQCNNSRPRRWRGAV